MCGVFLLGFACVVCHETCAHARHLESDASDEEQCVLFNVPHVCGFNVLFCALDRIFSVELSIGGFVYEHSMLDAR